MCQTCGCSTGHQHGGDHDHGHGRHPPSSITHPHSDAERRAIEINTSLLARNDKLAERNRGIFLAKGVAVLNLVSSPGSGKTAILERTLRDLGGELKMAVIVGDLATENDARRLRRCGAPAVQITTGTVCHLDAHMVHHALDGIALGGLDVLFIENVGNLVCPAAFDLGEDERVVVTSVTEGEDKPQKYPSIFQDASVVLLNKVDLASVVGFDHAAALRNLREAAPGARLIDLSAKTGYGMTAWYEHLRAAAARKKEAAPA